MSLEVNLVGVAVCAVAIMLLGMLWFSPLLFGNAWMRAMGINMNDIDEAKQGDMGKAYATSLVASLIIAASLSLLLNNLPLAGALQGALLGLFCWFGFNLVSTAKGIVWEDRPLALAMIVDGYEVVCFMLAGTILGAWG